MQSVINIGTRESELAVWQATQVKSGLKERGYTSRLVFIKSEGDIDLQTPLYEMGVQGIFTKSLDMALLSGKIDIAVHSMKDVPTQLPIGIVQAAVMKRGNYKDLFVINESMSQLLMVNDENAQLPSEYEKFLSSLKSQEISPRPNGSSGRAFAPYKNIGAGIHHSHVFISTSSIRRKAQWLHRYPNHIIENLRGNINTRMRKVAESNWHGAVFAAAGLERINLRPQNSIELDWMLPAPAQGAIMLVCRENDNELLNACTVLNHEPTATCTKIERDFLRELLGGCSTPISALAEICQDEIYFKGNIFSIDGKQKVEIEKSISKKNAEDFGKQVAIELYNIGGKEIADAIRNQQ